LLSQEISRLKEMENAHLVWEEPGFSFWFVEMGDTLTFHMKHDGVMNVGRFKRMQYRLDQLTLLLMDKGMKKMETWIKNDDVASLKFAELFGFRKTGFEIVVVDPRNGREHDLTELYLTFPED
jgi:hypothetical protein